MIACWDHDITNYDTGGESGVFWLGIIVHCTPTDMAILSEHHRLESDDTLPKYTSLTCTWHHEFPVHGFERVWPYHSDGRCFSRCRALQWGPRLDVQLQRNEDSTVSTSVFWRAAHIKRFALWLLPLVDTQSGSGKDNDHQSRYPFICSFEQTQEEKMVATALKENDNFIDLIHMHFCPGRTRSTMDD